MMPRSMAGPTPMSTTTNAASEIPMSANLKEIKESMNQKSESENQKQ